MKVAGIRSTECREFLDKLQLPIAPLEKLGTEISLGARRRSLDKANPDKEQGVRFLDDLELACATRPQLLVRDEKLSIPPPDCRRFRYRTNYDQGNEVDDDVIKVGERYKTQTQ